MEPVRLILGDCVEALKELPDNSADSVVTDPPYELGLMGHGWDASGISKRSEVWEELLRVLKPGGHLLSFGGARTSHRMVCAIEDAGFEIRDQLMWVYGGGMPKSHDAAKSVTKLAGEGEGERWEGWGTGLKPAHEPICLARKPLSEATVAENLLRWGTGSINIDGCRVPSEGAGLGRWPANLIHDGSDEVAMCFPDAPGQMADASRSLGARKNRNVYGVMRRGSATAIVRRQDKGSAARFFYCARASRADRGEGNNHPTVKPTKLMRYLCRLVTPPGGLVVDPFMGSGSTGVSALLEGLRFIGIEMNPEYFEIANRRVLDPQG